MAKRNHTVEQIIVKLREIDIWCKQGQTVHEACKRAEITENTFYKWRKQYGSMTTDDARRLSLLEKENARLKKLVADLSLDNQILKEVNSNFY